MSGNKAKIKAGDEVLWDLAPSYPYPEELVVSAPQQATAGVPFAVHVYAYNEKGKRRPVQGAAVTGAIGPTDKSGKVMITLTEPTALIAGLGDDIPSAAGAGLPRRRSAPPVADASPRCGGRESRCSFWEWRSRPPAAGSARAPRWARSTSP